MRLWNELVTMKREFPMRQLGLAILLIVLIISSSSAKGITNWQQAFVRVFGSSASLAAKAAVSKGTLERAVQSQMYAKSGVYSASSIAAWKPSRALAAPIDLRGCYQR